MDTPATVLAVDDQPTNLKLLDAVLPDELGVDRPRRVAGRQREHRVRLRRQHFRDDLRRAPVDAVEDGLEVRSRAGREHADAQAHARASFG